MQTENNTVANETPSASAALMNWKEEASAPVAATVVFPKKLTVVGFDIGFAESKVFDPRTGKTTSIPSAVAKPQEAIANMGGGQNLFIMENGVFTYGLNAMESGSQQIQALTTDWLLEHIAGMICAAAKAASIDLHDVDVLSTGLPINAWIEHGAYLSEKLKVIRCNQQTYTFSRVDVHAQGIGALGYHGQLGAPQGENGVVLDIGGNTILAVRYNNLRPTATASREYDESGVLSVAKALQPALAKINDGQPVSIARALKALLARTYCGDNISPQINSAVDAYVARIVAMISADYRKIIRDADGMLVVAGGGAYYLGDALKKAFPHVTILPDPSYANVKGYAYLSSFNN